MIFPARANLPPFPDLSRRVVVKLVKKGKDEEAFAFARYHHGLDDWVIEGHGGDWKVRFWFDLPVSKSDHVEQAEAVVTNEIANILGLTDQVDRWLKDTIEELAKADMSNWPANDRHQFERAATLAQEARNAVLAIHFQYEPF